MKNNTRIIHTFAFVFLRGLTVFMSSYCVYDDDKGLKRVRMGEGIGGRAGWTSMFAVKCY